MSLTYLVGSCENDSNYFLFSLQTNVDQWQTAFLIAAGVSFIGNLVFVIGGSAERQPWDEPKKTHEGMENDDIASN